MSRNKMTGTRQAKPRKAEARSPRPRKKLPASPDGGVVHKPPAQEISEDIIDLIERQAFLPGERLREQDLADRFGVTRARVREALHILEARNFVKIERMKGATISRLDSADVVAIAEVRSALIELAARRAAQYAAAEEKRRISECAEALTESAAAMTPREFRNATGRLGDAISAGAHSAYLARTISDVHRSHGSLRFYSLLGIASRSRRLQASRNWLKVAEAIERGDGAAAERTVRKIYEQAVRAVEMVIASGSVI